MKQVERENYINVKSWMDLGDCNYENDHADDSIPEQGVVYCNIEHIPDFFKKRVVRPSSSSPPAFSMFLKSVLYLLW